MTQITTQNQNLYQLQETVLKTLGGLLGKSIHIPHALSTMHCGTCAMYFVLSIQN